MYWGGEFRGGKRGRGSPNKTPFVAAVSVDTEGHPIAMNMNVVKGFRSNEIERGAKRHLQPGNLIVSDGLACFLAVKKAGGDHTVIVTGGGPDCVSLESFTGVNTLIANVKRSMDMLPRFGYIAARTPPMPNRLLKLAENYG